MINQQDTPAPWPLWRKIIFRFLFIYLCLQVISWPYFKHKKALYYLEASQNAVLNTTVNTFNDWFTQLPAPLVDYNNNHDTPFRVVLLFIYAVVAFAGTLIWTFALRAQRSYHVEDYYFKALLRYFVAYISIVYGTVKLFMLQMPFPLLSEMATPLGDLSPMSLSWLYVGYSPMYEFFLGMAEVLAGVLLIYRRTALLGLFMALGIYINVLMINLAYDVPVKIFSFHLVFICSYLMLDDLKRIINFFILDKAVMPSAAYVAMPATRQHRVIKRGLKVVFILICCYVFMGRAQRLISIKDFSAPIPPGLYEVTTFVKNGDTLPVLANDSLIWKDVIFESTYSYATVNSADRLFSRDNSRGGFFYKADTLNHTLKCYRSKAMKAPGIFTLHYRIPDSTTVLLRTKIASDSLSIKLTRSKKKFRLSGRPFHWIEKHGR